MWVVFETRGAIEHILNSVREFEKGNIGVYRSEDGWFSLIKFESNPLPAKERGTYYIYETDFQTLEDAKRILI